MIGALRSDRWQRSAVVKLGLQRIERGGGDRAGYLGAVAHDGCLMNVASITEINIVGQHDAGVDAARAFAGEDDHAAHFRKRFASKAKALRLSMEGLSFGMAALAAYILCLLA